jgi:hypothetical protein
MYLRGESDILEDIADVIPMLASKWRKSKFQTSPMPGRRTSSWWKKHSIASNFQATRVPYAPQPLNVSLGNREGNIRGGLIGIVQAGWLHRHPLDPCPISPPWLRG